VKKKKNTTNGPVARYWRYFFYTMGGGIFFLLLINFGLFGSMPSLSELENPSIVLASEVYGDDGTPLGKYYRDKGNRSNVFYRDISKYVIDALVATEDERFYSHSGIDAISVARAVASLGTEGGGSTITQQLAKNMLDQGSKNIFLRIIEKLKEWIIAIKLERNFTKQEILSLYLNTVPFGENTQGIRNAGRTFFQKEPDRLTVDEAALLIGMLKGNTIYNPRKNYKAAFDRRNVVLQQMVKNDYLSEKDYASLKSKPIKLNYKKLDEKNGIAPYFLDVIREELKEWCRQHQRPDDENYDLYSDGLKIYTSINPRMQLYAEEAVAKHVPVLQRVLSNQFSVRKGTIWKGHEKTVTMAMRASDRWKTMKEEGFDDKEIEASFNKKIPMKVFAWNSKREKDTSMSPIDSIKYHKLMLQTAFMAMDPLTGHVKAWVGGIDFRNYKYDHVNLRTKRQVGSTIKPLLYTLAMQEYGFTPETECEATQQYFPGSGYVPAKNSGRTGTRTMASGLAWSVNEVAAYLIKQTTPKRFADFIAEINIPTKVNAYPSISLGSCELSLFEMLWGYTMFPTGGFSTKPIYITRIEDKHGNILARFDTERKEVISHQTAFTMTRMMQGVVDYGTAAGLRERLGALEMAGKTGTTNDNTDAWFIGFTPQLLAGVWIGCDDPFIRLEGGLGYGGQAARPIWEYFFQKSFNDKIVGLDRSLRFAEPENLRAEQAFDYNLLQGAPDGDEILSEQAEEYLSTPDTQDIPVESKESLEEQKVLQEATNPKNQIPTVPEKKTEPLPPAPPSKEEKKKGFLKKIFKKNE